MMARFEGCCAAWWNVCMHLLMFSVVSNSRRTAVWHDTTDMDMSPSYEVLSSTYLQFSPSHQRETLTLTTTLSTRVDSLNSPVLAAQTLLDNPKRAILPCSRHTVKPSTPSA